MVRRHEDLVDEVLVARVHRARPAPAAPLRAVLGDGHPLDVAEVRDGDDDLLVGDQVGDVDLALLRDDLRAALVAVAVANFLKLVGDDLLHHGGAREDRLEVRDAIRELAVLRRELLALEPGEARQAHVEDRLRLPLAEPVVDALPRERDLALRAAGTAHELLEPAQRQLHQALARDLRIGRLADRADHEVDLGRGHAEAFDDLARSERRAKLEARAARDDLAAMLDEVLERLLEVQHLRLTRDDGERVDAERRLQRGQLIQLVEHDLPRRVALELDHHTHPVTVGLVAEVADALDALLADELSDLLEELGLVDLIRQLRDDDHLAVVLVAGDRLDGRARPHHDAPAPGVQRRADAGRAVDEPGRREVGPLHAEAPRRRLVDHQLIDGDLGALQDAQRRVEDLGEVVRRDVRRHADGDAARAVDEEVREARRQHARLFFRLVEVRDEVDRLLVDVGEQLGGEARHAHLRVTHRGRRIAVDGAEVPLAVDQRIAKREVLRHADERVVDALVAVRVVLAEHVADDARGLLVRLVPEDLLVLHGEEDASVDGLEAVADVRDGPADDDAHRVPEVRGAELFFDRDRDFLCGVGHGRGDGITQEFASHARTRTRGN